MPEGRGFSAVSVNLALPVLILALALLPGIFFRLTLLSKVAHRTVPSSPGGLLEDFAAALIPALLVHLGTTGILRLFGVTAFGPLSNAVLLPVLSGQFGSDAKLLKDSVLLLTPETLLSYTLYTLMTSGLGALAGLGVLWLYIQTGNDARLVPFPARPWYERLEQQVRLRTLEYNRIPNAPPGVVNAALSTVVDFGGESYLFYGLVDDWYIDRSGQLERVELKAAERRGLERDKTPDMDSEADAARYYTIEAEILVLRTADMKSVAIDYIVVREASGGDAPRSDEGDSSNGEAEES